MPFRDRERVITLLFVPGKSDGAVSGTGLKEKDDALILSKAFSFLLSGSSIINVEFLLSMPEENGNFPVVGDGCTCNIDKNFYMKENLEEEHLSFRIIGVHIEVQGAKRSHFVCTRGQKKSLRVRPKPNDSSKLSL